MQQQRKQRTKERYVWEAMELVQMWRYLYKEGVRIENNLEIKYNLEQAAEKVGCPKKTLEDYYYLLRKAKDIVNLDEKKQEKMGYIRKICREYKKQKQQDPIQIKQEEEMQFDVQENGQDD